MSAPIKRFDDASAYGREIVRLVPGYEALHQMVPALLRAVLGSGPARLLVVGCGPGDEIVRLAEVSDEWSIDALDVSLAMVEAARERVREAELERRVAVVHGAIGEIPVGSYDAVVAVLVGHFVADDGGRLAFLRGVARQLRPRRHAVLVDFIDDGGARRVLTQAHLHWSESVDVPKVRLGAMRDRLNAFAALTPQRSDELLREAGLHFAAEFFRAFGVVGTLVRRASEKEPEHA